MDQSPYILEDSGHNIFPFAEKVLPEAEFPIVYKYFEGTNCAKIARELGLDPRTVRKRLNSGIARLRHFCTTFQFDDADFSDSEPKLIMRKTRAVANETEKQIESETAMQLASIISANYDDLTEKLIRKAQRWRFSMINAVEIANTAIMRILIQIARGNLDWVIREKDPAGTLSRFIFTIYFKDAKHLMSKSLMGGGDDFANVEALKDRNPLTASI